MTDNEIIKAVECCLAKENCEVISCEKCPLEKQYECMDIMFHQTLDLINHQKAEIESLKHRKTELQIRNQELQHEKSEAIKEFAEKLKEKATSTFYEERKYVDTEDIDNLVKERTEVETNQRKEDEGK